MSELDSMFRRRAKRRGVTLLLVALLLPILFLFAGFAIDLANMQRTRTELRVATDLAAKAAAETLATTGDKVVAIAIGKQISSQNQVNGNGLTLGNSDFVFGASSQMQNGKWSFTPSASNMNAVQVVGKRTNAAPDGPINLYFGGLTGSQTFEPTVTAAAAFRNVDICLVLDRSSSMKRDLSESGGLDMTDPRWCSPPNGAARWKDLDTAVGNFIDELQDLPGDENVGLVTFGGPMDPSAENCSGTADHSVVSIDVQLTTNLTSIENAVSARSNSIWNGNTDIAKGLETGIGVLLNSRPGSERIMILLTDGQYTEDSPLPWAATAAANDIVVHTITFGNLPQGPGDTWIADMQQIAADTSGTHLHAPTKQALKNAFADLASSIAVLIQ